MSTVSSQSFAVPPASLDRRLVAETLATCLLTATVVGSGIMAERLCPGSIGLALLANALATGAGLTALILAFGGISGAHMNPLVTVAVAARGGLAWREVPVYAAGQATGAVAGAVLANAMFSVPALALATGHRAGRPLWLGEGVATAGLLLIIFGVASHRHHHTPYAVAGYITAAYWFTSSTSFANPAITLGRAFTRSFTGIHPADVPGFVLAQCAGALLAMPLCAWLFPPSRPPVRSRWARCQRPAFPGQEYGR